MTIECSARDATVRAAGWIILTWELADLLSRLEKLHSTLDGSFKIECMEPHLSLEFKAGKTGKIEFIVRLTPDLMNQEHSFKFDIDQSYLPETIRQLLGKLPTPLERYYIISRMASYPLLRTPKMRPIHAGRFVAIHCIAFGPPSFRTR